MAIDSIFYSVGWSAPTGIICKSYISPWNSGVIVAPAGGTGYGIAVDDINKHIYYADGAILKRCDFDGGNITTIVSSVPGFSILSIDTAGGKLYWSSSSLWRIKRCNLDGSGEETLYQNVNNLSIQGIGLDIINGNLYFSSTLIGGFTPAGIFRIPITGGAVTRLVAEANTYGMAIDLVNSKMYWSNTTNKIIKRANLDGSSIETVIAPGPTIIPVDIMLDLVAGKIYYNCVISSVYWFKRCNLDGTGNEAISTTSELKRSYFTLGEDTPQISEKNSNIQSIITGHRHIATSWHSDNWRYRP